MIININSYHVLNNWKVNIKMILSINISEKRNSKQKMKKILFIFYLSILFSLNQAKNLSIKNHDLAINKTILDKYYKENHGIEKKKSRL